ncbi:MAG TPA: FkbM family methyltransferase [Candidatus Accumulibacter phosphatis]|nr:FkbM family methyltransferase [Candidatus Accumulibacter phosphatis]
MRAAKILDSLTTLKGLGLGLTTVVDVGVQHSTPALMAVFPTLPHVLFEPVEEYYPFIRKNYCNISHTLVEAAVSDFDGELTLHTEKKTRGDEISHSYIVRAPTASSRTVRTLTLDGYFRDHPRPGPLLLKIDVEGPDVPNAILRGATAVLSQTAAVVIEMTVDKFMERAILLHEAGFDVWDICDLCYYQDCLWQADVVFVNRRLKDSNQNLRPMHIRPFRPELWQSGF